MPKLIRPLVLSLMLTACSSKRANPWQNEANRAPADVTLSFRVTTAEPAPPAALKVDRARVTILKAALEKEFLLQGSLIMQNSAPSFEGLQSRIVFFRRVEGQVYMIEASQGQRATRDYPQTLSLAQFPILSEEPDALTIDFNKGMAQVGYTSDWHSRDSDASPRNLVLKTQFSYVAEARVVGTGTLEIHQHAQVELPMDPMIRTLPVETVYYLSPYLPNPDFKPTVAPRTLDTVGFFEADTQYTDQSGRITYASKHDERQPITYAISANTPSEYREAVREGILHWNKIFGRELVKVVDAPADLIAPTPLHNIVQWVDFASAGFARADAQLDPRSGQILHHQIYMTSGWAQYARTTLKEIDDLTNVRLQMKGLGSSRLCDLSATHADAQNMAAALATRSPEQILRVSQDMIREVIAHEVGHTLGLRHNFAGSLAANYPVGRLESVFRDYVDRGTVPADLITTASLMDYPTALGRPLLGAQIRAGALAPAYDGKALRHLYDGEVARPADTPAFCTDSHVGTYLDCQRWDHGPSPFEWTKYNLGHALSLLPYGLLQAYAEAKAPYFAQAPHDLAEVQFTPKFEAMLALAPAELFLNVFRKDARLLTIDRQFSAVGRTEATELRQRTVDVVAAELTRLGGVAGVLPKISAELTNQLGAEFEKLLERPDLVRGTNADGRPYEFTTDELVRMREDGRRFFKQLLDELAHTELSLLAGRSPIDDYLSERFGYAGPPPAPVLDSSRIAQDLAHYVGDRVKHFVLSTAGEPLVYTREVTTRWSNSGGVSSAGPKESLQLALPQFSYPFDIRRQAAHLLDPGRAESPAWGFAERRDLENDYSLLMAKALPGVNTANPSTFDRFPREVVYWILQEKDIESAVKTTGLINPQPNPAPAPAAAN